MNYDLHANYPKLVENQTAYKLGQPKATQDFVWTDEYDDQPVELTTLMRSMMNANNREMAKLFVSSWFRMACHGNPTAIHELLDRIEGPIQNELEESE